MFNHDDDDDRRETPVLTPKQREAAYAIVLDMLADGALIRSRDVYTCSECGIVLPSDWEGEHCAECLNVLHHPLIEDPEE